MTNTVCYRRVVDQDEPAWLRCQAPPLWEEVDGTLLLQAPGDMGVTVNGLEVIGGLQVLKPGDLVRTPDGLYLAGRPTAHVEPGGGRRCALTGVTMTDELAVRCVCGQVYSQRAADQMSQCPSCGSPLDQVEQPAPEEML